MYTYGITGTSIDEFQDTTVTAVTGGQALVYNDVTGQWENTNIVGGTGIDATYTGIPANFEGLYNGGAAYGIGDVVIADGAPYGIEGNYYIRTTNPGNPGYPPAVGGGNNTEWDEYPFSVNIEVSLDAALTDLSDTVITSPTEFQTLEYNGTSWVNTHASTATLVRNVDSVTLGTGTAVYLFGATGDKASVKRADNDSDTTSSKVVGLVASPILANATGVVVTRGYVDGINLSSGYAEGDILYLAEDGGFTKVKPVAPEHSVFLGVVVRANANGIVYVGTQNGYELEELHNVKINGTLADNDVLQYDSATDLWKNEKAKTVVRDNTQQQGEPQAPANGRLHGPNNSLLLIIGVGVYVGGVMKIVFNQACTVTELGLVLAATYTNATSRTYRLGAYADNGTGDFPGALIEDLGLVTIAQNATAGFKSIALTTPLAVAAGTTIWTAVNCQHIGSTGTFPAISYCVGNSNPYANYGIALTGSTNAAAFNQNGTQTTAFANPYVLQANPVTSQAVVAYVKVTVP